MLATRENRTQHNAWQNWRDQTLSIARSALTRTGPSAMAGRFSYFIVHVHVSWPQSNMMHTHPKLQALCSHKYPSHQPTRTLTRNTCTTVTGESNFPHTTYTLILAICVHIQQVFTARTMFTWEHTTYCDVSCYALHTPEMKRRKYKYLTWCTVRPNWLEDTRVKLVPKEKVAMACISKVLTLTRDRP